MKFSFKIMFSNWSHNIKNRIKIRRLGKKKEAKQCKKLLKAILNSVDSVFAVSQNIENFGFRADEERPLHIDRSVTMAVASKKYYNGSVRIFNTKIQVFPNNIIAKLFNFKEANMFEANADEKNNVKVDL